jgi:hypothetical protein
MTSKDRRTRVIQSPDYNGIDFVEIADPSQLLLRVHFLNVVELAPLTSEPTITGGESIPTVAVEPVQPGGWGFDEGHLVLQLKVAAPGDFSTYTLTIASPLLDPYFDHAAFSFKALCPSDLDCETPPAACPPLVGDVPPIDYLAKDFLSFRQALLDFSALRYPQWQERSEADFGMMFAEALSAVADDLSYTQDRFVAEAALATATQRRSAIRHAGLVDYTPGPALSAGVMLQFDVAPGTPTIPAGLAAVARAPDGTPVYFETGPALLQRLLDPVTGAAGGPPPQYPVSSLWNSDRIKAYWFDDSHRCLMAGATDMYVLGRGYGFTVGQAVLIRTPGATTADPPLLQIVTLTAVDEQRDRIFTRTPTPGGPPFMTCPTSPPASEEPTAVTHLVWGSADRLTENRDLTVTTVVGNLVPAIQGLTVAGERFVVAAPPFGGPATATIVRTGPRPTQADGTPGAPFPLQLYSLARGPVAWLAGGSDNDAEGAGAGAQPELLLLQEGAVGAAAVWKGSRKIVDAGAFDRAYTLDAVRLAAIARNSDQSLQYDYAGDGGDTIRFGGNGFGILPDDGTYFTVTYRIGAGAGGNVAGGAVNQLAPGSAAAGILTVTNPLPAAGGADPETLDSIRLSAPQAFRARQLRAVLPADYDAAASTLSWVQRAGTTYRWTGSWLTVFTAVDPLGSETIPVDLRTDLIALLNRYRMAGYEVYAPDPEYVSIDLSVTVCAAPTAFDGDVEGGVLTALNPGGRPGGGFFNVNNFTFGQPLERSALEAVIQRVAGVAGVLCIQYRLRDRLGGLVEMGDQVTVGTNQIIRCDNDASLPEHGSIHVAVSGGR